MSFFNYKYLILILLTFTVQLFAQNQDEQKFNEAVKLFRNKQYQSALNTFQSISNKENPNQTAAKFFVVKTYIELKKYTDAEKEAADFLQKFGLSKYADEVSILLVKSQLEQKKYKSAFSNTIKLIKSSSSTSYKIDAKSIAQKIAGNYLSSYDLKEFSDKENDKKIKAFLLYTLAKLYSLEGQSDKGIKILEEIVNEYPQTDEYFLARNSLSSNQNQQVKDEIIVGVILPLTDKDGKRNIAAEEMLEGIKYAFHEINFNRDNKIGLLIRDSKRNEEEIRDIVQEFDSDKRVKAVIGPVYSDESEIVVSALSQTDLVFISPTATDEDLTENNDQFYQANPPFTVRGKVFAQYIFLKEGKRSFAVLNSLDGYSPILAKSFVDEFQRLGGNILIKETYRSKSVDLSKQISNLSQHLGNLDGVYIPLSDKYDAEIILSEMLKQNFIVPVYGNQDWLNAKGLETSSTISNTLKITSDYFIDFSDFSFNEFNEKFLNTTGKDITRNVLYGYDTAKYLVSVMRSIQSRRNTIKLKIDSGIKINGFHNNISFSKKKRNLYLNILSYSDGKFQLIEKYRGTE
ncbi:ABC-type branched-chain amino acid transport system periplasmic subunit [Ignavibacterium album JCM 16511]|uniref:ABC-type branched-chain amino acid transport system periplasmic subunit n=1 Tax=Ignavibacterium album (strain DSM 19864 / JCM 16511 / NBRC 101810 / Mat9-16) TaxID=945713 RepID=I0AHR7_IGNAJ|nr:penicillin-binding protein activator [Ignavibacterium album]AFH48524.1 ABC-type branched-chain amino acid transport system periplasmic subunit [Ignavibacterium album JCM 16511]